MARDALAGRCEMFDGDRCRHDGHRAQVHDPTDEKHRRQAGTAVAAVNAEASGRVRPCRCLPSVRPRPGASRQQVR